ncbi:MAG: glycine--tRNA ligase, partial [Nanoarchaeota archaeon]
MTSPQDKLKEITQVAERRGFFFPTAEIYGGKAGFYTYGHLGKAIKNKFEALWRKHFLEENCYEIEGNTILPEDVFKASGHLKSFTDPLTECKACHFRFRADQLIEDSLKIKAEGLSIEDLNKIIKENKLKCPKCGSQNLTEVEWFNMMFPLTLGAAGSKEIAYLSPETAQNPYLAFEREFEATRKKLPLGIAMIGKAYRNEISPRQLFFRLREFTQAELQVFFDPDDINKHEKWNLIKSYKLRLMPVSERKSKKVKELRCEDANKKLKLPKMYLYYMQKMHTFFLEVLQIPREKFYFYELSEEERAFYNKFHWDVYLELETLGGFKEVTGLHYRTDHDLGGHAKQSKKSLEVF